MLGAGEREASLDTCLLKHPWDSGLSVPVLLFLPERKYVWIMVPPQGSNGRDTSLGVWDGLSLHPFSIIWK